MNNINRQSFTSIEDMFKIYSHLMRGIKEKAIQPQKIDIVIEE